MKLGFVKMEREKEKGQKTREDGIIWFGLVWD
jgi:hypothetical protein